MFLFNDVFSLRHLWLKYLPQKVLLLSIPLAIFVHIFLDRRTWILFWFFLFILISIEIVTYKRCEKKHDELIEKYGDRYLNILERQLKEVGLNELIDRYWTGLEPK